MVGGSSNVVGAVGNVGKALDELLRDRGPSRKVTVPELVGLSVPDMWLVALRAGVRVHLRHVSPELPRPGRVVGQTPDAGTRVRRDSVVDLLVTFEPLDPGGEQSR